MSRSFYNKFIYALLILASLLTVSLLVFLIGYILISGVPSISYELLATQTSYIKDTIGIMPNIVNTVYLIIVSMLIALPISVGAAIYLTEYAENKKLIAIIEFATETLTGIPSIIFGLVGMLIFTQFFGLRQGILAGSLTLVMIIVPTIIRTTQESLKTVPAAYKEGALALGAAKWHTIRTVVLPSAVDGIVTACILSVGRIIGESAALLFTAGFGLVLNDFIKSLTASSASLTVALYVYAGERGETEIAFAIAVILLLISFLINGLVNISGKRLRKEIGR